VPLTKPAPAPASHLGCWDALGREESQGRQRLHAHAGEGGVDPGEQEHKAAGAAWGIMGQSEEGEGGVQRASAGACGL